MFSKTQTMRYTKNFSDKIIALGSAIKEADAIVIGAGAGLSTSAGFTYDGERFEKHFSDFGSRYGFRDMYSGGFYPYKTPEEFWAYWSRYIMINRYEDAPKPVYDDLFRLVDGRDYFVITTNVDHCFQKAGFDKKRLFYTQGDYGLFQCSLPCRQETYDNEQTIRDMVRDQQDMRIPSGLIPTCPRCGRPLTTNLRSDGRFVEDEDWHKASQRYTEFLSTRRGKVLFLELGVGYNTPGIIKYPFWQMTAGRPDAVYACVNKGETVCPKEIADRSILIDGDIGDTIKTLLASQKE